MVRGGHIYILTNKTNKVLYTGVTSELRNRVWDHKAKLHPKSFSARYNTNKLVYFESFVFIEEAIAREKQIKAGSRMKKIRLIEQMNPNWNDLFDALPED